MSNDRFKEVFRRLTAETPEPPAFSDLETQHATADSPTWMKPWIAVAGAAALVLIVIGGFGALGGGGPDLAQPEEPTVGYIKLNYTGSANPICEGGTVFDNGVSGSHHEATIEIWGPSSDELTLMLVTFPDGSTERAVVKGDPLRPERAWANDPDEFPYNTGFRVIHCEGTESDDRMIHSGFVNPEFGLTLPTLFLPNDGEPPWQEMGEEPVHAEWNGTSALLYEMSEHSAAARKSLDLYVTDDNRTLLRFYARTTYPGVGSSVVDIQLVVKDLIAEDTISFDTAGLTSIEYTTFQSLGRENCPVTIPSRSMVPPDSHPETPSGYPENYWFGKEELFTSLPSDGVYQPRKSVWWSVNFPGDGVENIPDITVSWTLLNSTRDMTITEDRSTNASTPEDGWFMMVGIDPPILGCWRVDAIYKSASLSYVYYNDSVGTRPEDIVVPDIVGMTVERARRVLDDNMYKASFVDSANPEYEVCTQDPAPGTELNPWQAVNIDAEPVGDC